MRYELTKHNKMNKFRLNAIYSLVRNNPKKYRIKFLKGKDIVKIILSEYQEIEYGLNVWNRWEELETLILRLGNDFNWRWLC